MEVSFSEYGSASLSALAGEERKKERTRVKIIEEFLSFPRYLLSFST